MRYLNINVNKVYLFIHMNIIYSIINKKHIPYIVGSDALTLATLNYK